jgi:hypothetical protein
LKFEILYTFSQRKGSFILARQLNPGENFALTDNSTLGGVQVMLLLPPRSVDGRSGMNIFQFKPRNRSHLEKLKKGDIVELEN